MQWWKKIKEFINILFEPDIVNDFIDDGKPFELLHRPRVFMDLSVKGDCRLYRLDKGFIAAWPDRIVARNFDGKLLWVTKGRSNALSIHPDGLIFAAAAGVLLCLFNVNTGKAIREPVILSKNLDFLIWLDKNRLVGSDGQVLFIFDAHAELLDILEGAVSPKGFLGGIAADPTNKGLVTILDVNGHLLKKIDISKRQVVEEKEIESSDQLIWETPQPWIVTTVVNGTDLEEIRVYDAKNLRERFAIIFNGKKGVRFANQQPNDLSFHSFVSLPSLSPLRQYLLINDNSGLLWLLDARTGDKRRIFRRNLLDFVLNTLWIDEEYFVAMLDGGEIVKMSKRGRVVEWRQKDI